jgi:hypothetical protein
MEYNYDKDGNLFIKYPEFKGFNMGVKSSKEETEKDFKYTISLLLDKEDEGNKRLIELTEKIETNAHKIAPISFPKIFYLPKCYNGYMDRDEDLKVKITVKEDKILIDEYINLLLDKFNIMRSGIRYINNGKIIRKAREDYKSVEEYINDIKHTFIKAKEQRKPMLCDDTLVYWKVEGIYLVKL